MSVAVFGAGCFWCVEAIFLQVKGVKEIVSGYTGGDTRDPTYNDICTGNTNHAEVCKIIYDSNQIDFTSLLKIFWETHNPTTLNKQGADIGTQYRSVIFYFNDKQKIEAEDSRKNYQKKLSNDIKTEIKKFTSFYKAEDYHQKYIQKKALN